MTLEDIKNLPDEFNFKSNINRIVPVYHAKKIGDHYLITIEGDTVEFDYLEKEFHDNLLCGDFEVIVSNEQKDRIKRAIMSSDKSDIRKLREVFNVDKDDMRQTNPQLYYAILGVLDTER